MSEDLQMELSDKVALVTGAGSGIGRATAVVLARHGARVALAGRNHDQLAETAALVEAAGGAALVVPTDVSVDAQVRDLVATTVEHFGGLDIACNNAGILGPLKPIVELTGDDFDLTMGTNLRGTFLCLKYELAAMTPRGSGSIVNISSVNAVMAEASGAFYCSSKSAMDMMTRVAALESGPAGIRVNGIRPGYVLTPMHDAALAVMGGASPELVEAVEATVPLGRRAEPEEIGEAVAWLCSPSASYVTGEILTVDGGLSNTPPG